MRESIKRRARC